MLARDSFGKHNFFIYNQIVHGVQQSKSKVQKPNYTVSGKKGATLF